MADDNSNGVASSSGVASESSESTVEVNIKTLDSQIYSFRVDKNMPVPLLKEKIANAVGVPVEQQRLIFRGKVLKDDHLISEYHVEDGHTLHLVARQPVQSGTNAGETTGNNDNRGNDAGTAAPRNRTGSISHSVVLGTFNIGDQGEGGVPDLTRIVGAVLNSIGIGGQVPSGGAGNISHVIPANSSSQVPQGVETEGTRVNAGGRSQTGNLHPGLTFSNQPFQSLPQSIQFPLIRPTVSIPTPQVPIPDSLHTISEFINRMETALLINGSQPSSSSTVGDRPTVDLPSNERGLPTPEALSIIIRRAQELLSGHTATALSHIAERLEGEQGSTDSAVRSQIQIEVVQTGLAVQHLGALLLELGRTILTLRMGQSPAESSVNAGPAVYISPSGPNPIMVQPFPLQTSSIFGGSAASQANSGPVGPIALGDAPRNINIHIHAVGSRESSGEATQEHPNGTRSGDPAQTRTLSGRNIIGAAIPSLSASHVLSVLHPSSSRSQQSNQSQAPAQGSGIAVSSSVQPTAGVSVTQSPSESVSIPTLVAEINAQIRNLVDNARGGNQVPSGQLESSTVDGSLNGSAISDDPSSHPCENVSIDAANASSGSFTEGVSAMEEQQLQPECHRSGVGGDKSGNFTQEATSANTTRNSSSFLGGETTALRKSEDGSLDNLKSTQSHESTPADKDVPLGLGLGGLQPKRRARQARSQMKNGGEKCSDTSDNQSQHTIASGQQVLRSLFSRGSSAANMRDSNGSPPSGQFHPIIGQTSESIPTGSLSSSGQFDISSMMSQVLNNPALDGLLAGVSEQTGVGSPGGFRNILEQFTQTPSVRNTLNNIVQQIDGQDLSNFSGLGNGQDGGLDLSRMVQQMMPIVSQALTRGSTQAESFHGVESDVQHRCNMSGPVRDEKLDNHNSQIDLQQTAERIGRHDPPGDIFHSVVEHAAHSHSEGVFSEDLIEELCSDEGLVNEFMEMLYRNIRQRLS